MVFVDGDVEVMCPSYAYFVKRKRGLKLTIERIMTSSLRRIYPSFLVKKFGVIVSEARMEEIKEKWKLFVETGAKPSRLKHKGRGKKPAFHFGIWRRYQNIPFITKDSRSQIEEQNAASDAFLTVIRDSFAREIAALTEHYSPNLWSKQKQWVPPVSQFRCHWLNGIESHHTFLNSRIYLAALLLILKARSRQ